MKMGKKMKKRVTVVFDEINLKKLREIQVKQIKKTSKTVSFSSVVNQVIRKSF